MPSLLEAIEAKYGDDKEALNVDLPIAIYVPRKNPRCCIPSLLVLNDCAIDSAGNSDQLLDKCERVEELDLAQNNLQSWTEILNILTQMPKLKIANLSFNAVKDCLDGIDMTDFPFLKMLVLNSTNVDWASVRRLLTRLPSLEELHLSKNEFKQIELEEDDFKSNEYRSTFQHNNIKRLHFTDNPITDWCEVCKLGRAFPKLESLILAHCPLHSLDTSSPSSSPFNYSRTESECEGSPSRDTPHEPFRQLGFLNLNSTSISSWDDVDRLMKFPALENLRIRNCPIFEYPMEYTEHERRQLLIARLPNIRILNGGGAISDEEREDAERAFIRYYMDKPESDKPERYADLVAVHGKLEPLVNIDLRPERRVKVIISCPQENLIEERLIDVYQTVLEMKQKLEPFSKIPANKMRLFYVDQDMKSITGPEEMKYPNKQLYSYNISTGDEIIVSAKLGKTTSLK